MRRHDNTPEALRRFIAHGVEFTSQASDQWAGTAPFSDGEGKFYVHPETGQWDDKRSGKNGNDVTFLEEMFKLYHDAPTDQHRRRLARLLELPTAAVRDLEWGWDDTNDAFILPQRNHRGRIHNLLRMDADSREVRGTWGCKVQLGGADALAKARTGVQVWVCEGPKDAIALRWRLDSLGYTSDIVTYVPGADQFREAWAEQFRGHRVRLCYDNDDAGRRGAKKAAKLLDGVAASIETLEWPEHYRKGWDVRDFFVYGVQHEVPAEESWRKFESLFRPVRAEVRRRFPIVNAAAILSGPDLEWLIDDLLPRRSLSLLYGAPGVGKSFVALYFAALVLAGGGRVLILGMEGHKRPRLRAMRRMLREMGHSPDLLDGLLFIQEMPTLSQPRDVDELIAAIERHGTTFDLIVIDPLNSAYGPGDENSTKDATAVKIGAEAIVQRLATAVLLLHHARKSDGAMRGSTVLLGGADVVLRLEQPSRGHLRLTCVKSRDFEGFEPRHFKFNEVLFKDGSNSVFVVPTEKPTASAVSASAEAVLAALRNAKQSLSRSAWESASPVKGGSFRRAVALLEQAGKVSKQRDGQSVIYTPSMRSESGPPSPRSPRTRKPFRRVGPKVGPTRPRLRTPRIPA